MVEFFYLLLYSLLPIVMLLIAFVMSPPPAGYAIVIPADNVFPPAGTGYCANECRTRGREQTLGYSSRVFLWFVFLRNALGQCSGAVSVGNSNSLLLVPL